MCSRHERVSRDCPEQRSGQRSGAASLEIKCWTCKNIDVEPTFRRRGEEFLQVILPLTIYQCGECDKRFIHLTDPLFDRNRKISAGVISGLTLIVLLVMLISDEDSQQAAQKPAVDQANGEPPLLSNAGNSQVNTSQPNGPPPGSVPDPGEFWSDRVNRQLALNLAKADVSGQASDMEAQNSAIAIKKSIPPAVNNPLAGNLRLLALEASDDNGTLVLKLQTQGGTVDHKSMVFNERRHVVDLLGHWQVSTAVGDITLNQRLVERIRVGNHEGYFRIVFDLAKPSNLKVSLDTSSDGLVLRVIEL